MTYQVIKRRGSNFYVYEQASKRINGKVVTTVCRCLGKASEADRNRLIHRESKKSDPAPPVEKVQSKKPVKPVIEPDTASLPKSEKVDCSISKLENGNLNSDLQESKSVAPSPTPPAPAPQARAKRSAKLATTPEPLKFRSFEANFDLEKANLSPRNLGRDQELMAQWLKQAGADPGAFPRIRLVRPLLGTSPSYKKPCLHRRAFVVKFPRGSSRTAFRAEYRKALAHAGLKLLQKERPELFKAMREELKKSHRQTTKHLAYYYRNGPQKKRADRKARERVAKGVFSTGIAGGHIPDTQGKGKVKPESLGLADSSRRKNWEAETSAVLGECIRAGFPRTIRKYGKELNRAMEEEKNARDAVSFPLTFSSAKGKRRINRAIARQKANREMIRKVRILRAAFSPLSTIEAVHKAGTDGEGLKAVDIGKRKQ